MNKERLEEIESKWERESSNYSWLLEKARLAEEYEEIIDRQNESLAELMQQNKRYRETLEFAIEYLKNSDIRQIQMIVSSLKGSLEGKINAR